MTQGPVCAKELSTCESVIWRVTRGLCCSGSGEWPRAVADTQPFLIPSAIAAGSTRGTPDRAAMESRPSCWQVSQTTSPLVRRLYHLPTVGPDVPKQNVTLQRGGGN